MSDAIQETKKLRRWIVKGTHPDTIFEVPLVSIHDSRFTFDDRVKVRPWFAGFTPCL
jgi:hypothetical protein